MAVFSVDSEAVMSATGAARASSDRIRAEVAGLSASLTALRDSWTGSASAAFQTTVEDWRGTQQIVERSLDSIHQALDTAARNYADTEQAALSMFP